MFHLCRLSLLSQLAALPLLRRAAQSLQRCVAARERDCRSAFAHASGVSAPAFLPCAQAVAVATPPKTKQQASQYELFTLTTWLLKVGWSLTHARPKRLFSPFPLHGPGKPSPPGLF